MSRESSSRISQELRRGEARILPGVEHRQSRYLNNRWRNRIALQANENIPCKGSSRRDMPSAFCPRMVPIAHTSPSAASAVRIGVRAEMRNRFESWPRSRVRSGPPKRSGRRTWHPKVSLLPGDNIIPTT